MLPGKLHTMICTHALCNNVVLATLSSLQLCRLGWQNWRALGFPIEYMSIRLFDAYAPKMPTFSHGPFPVHLACAFRVLLLQLTLLQMTLQYNSASLPLGPCTNSNDGAPSPIKPT